MSPGFCYPVYPKTDMAGKEPAHILVAGDGDFSAHLMRPKGDLTYEMELIKYEDGTVGSLGYYDLDQDGWLEFFVPNYDGGYVDVYSFYDMDAEEELVFLQ